MERQALEGEVLGERQNIYNLEEKIRILEEDNQQLSMVNEERLADIEAWKDRYEQFERQIITETEDMRREYDDKIIDEIVNENKNTNINLIIGKKFKVF